MKSSPVRDHVLVAEDNAVVRRLVVAQLRKAGFAVLEAKDGVEALELFNREPTPVVVTDLGMPRFGGMELLAALRGVVPPPEVIVLTGTHAQDARAAVQALRLGAHDYIVKDADAAGAIPHAVARALEKWRLREENARLLGELRQLSMTDGLTGLGNRRAFDEALRQEIARFGRTDSPLSLVLLDLDHFKRVNDTLGHRVGDEVLVSFAARLRSVARESDRLFRYGGEEFAVLAMDSDEDGATSLAWRVVRATASRPFTAGQRRVEVTCSAGVAAATRGDDPAGESVVGKADAALYRAKRQGRNRACVASGPVATARSRPAFELSEESC